MDNSGLGKQTSILVADDDPAFLSVIKDLLEVVGYTVNTATNGAEALAQMRQNQVNLIIADIAMPEMNGYQLLERVKTNVNWSAIPFVFLTARDLDSDIRYGKELGVDDYLVKPVRYDDLLATIRGKLRRAAGPSITVRSSEPQIKEGIRDDLFMVGQIRIDPLQHRAWFGGKQVKLSAREFKLLERLARADGNVVSPQTLVRATHGLKTDRDEAGTLVRPMIRSLRRKLGFQAGDMGCIENVRGVGYRLLLT